jgi:hypothetical protein
MTAARQPPGAAGQTRLIDADCGHLAPDYLCWEREGKTFCEVCFARRLATLEGRAYEAWFVRG